MREYVLTAALIAGFVTPALAIGNEFYLAADLASGKCMVMTHTPDTSKYKMMGTYKSGGSYEGNARHGHSSPSPVRLGPPHPPLTSTSLGLCGCGGMHQTQFRKIGP